MKNKSTKTIFTSITLIAALLQWPYSYYYADGLLGFLTMIPYMLTGCVLTTILLISLIKYNQTNTIYHSGGLFLTVIIAFLPLFLKENWIEKLDWKLRLTERNRIVELIKAGKLCPYDNNSICKLPGFIFPPISVGGNEITIVKGNAATVTIEFFIDRGLLDNYSAFVYTNNTEDVLGIERMIKERHSPKFIKLQKNWYRVSY